MATAVELPSAAAISTEPESAAPAKDTVESFAKEVKIPAVEAPAVTDKKEIPSFDGKEADPAAVAAPEEAVPASAAAGEAQEETRETAADPSAETEEAAAPASGKTTSAEEELAVKEVEPAAAAPDVEEETLTAEPAAAAVSAVVKEETAATTHEAPIVEGKASE